MVPKNGRKNPSFSSRNSFSIFIGLFFLVLISTSFFSFTRPGFDSPSTDGNIVDTNHGIDSEIYADNEINFTAFVWKNGSAWCEYWFNWTENIDELGVNIKYPVTAQNFSYEGNANATEIRTYGYTSRIELSYTGNESYIGAHVCFEWPDCAIVFDSRYYFAGSSHLMLPVNYPYSGVRFPTNIKIILPQDAMIYGFLEDVESGPELDIKHNTSNTILSGDDVSGYLSRFSFALPSTIKRGRVMPSSLVRSTPPNYRFESCTNNNIKLSYHEVFRSYTNVTSILANQVYEFLQGEFESSPSSPHLEILFVPDQYISRRTRGVGYAFYSNGRVFIPACDIMMLNINSSWSLKVLCHEMTHAFTPVFGPAFFYEGLAELYAIEALKALGHNEYAIGYNNGRLNLASNFSKEVDNRRSLILEWNWMTLENLHKSDEDFDINYAYAYSLYLIQTIYNQTTSYVYNELFDLMLDEGVFFISSIISLPFLSSIDLYVFFSYLESATNISVSQLFVGESLPLGISDFLLLSLLFAIMCLISIALWAFRIKNSDWRKTYRYRRIILPAISFMSLVLGLILNWMINLFTIITNLYIIYCLTFKLKTNNHTQHSNNNASSN